MQNIDIAINAIESEISEIKKMIGAGRARVDSLESMLITLKSEKQQPLPHFVKIARSASVTRTAPTKMTKAAASSRSRPPFPKTGFEFFVSVIGDGRVSKAQIVEASIAALAIENNKENRSKLTARVSAFATAGVISDTIGYEGDGRNRIYFRIPKEDNNLVADQLDSPKS